MSSIQTPVTFEPFFGGFILETLTIGMYGESRNAIREYIQNGFDSIRRARSDGLLAAEKGLITIHLDKDNRTVTIRDDGTGISERHAVDILTRIGASTKDHRKTAGFRGIGRLAGIVFCDRVVFKTKAHGEENVTTVVFDAKKMREEMAPNRGSRQSATDLISDTVQAHKTRTRQINDHYLEVRLEGLSDEPEVCRSALAMRDFVSQVAPVPYGREFPFSSELESAAKGTGISVEQVRISVREGKKRGIEVTKPYRKTHEVGSTDAKIEHCEIVKPRSGNWWGWVGKKTVSGAFTDTRVAGLRVRVRNIQIDGTELVREIFREKSSSHNRFQDYFVGEIFIRPGVLVPNARRDNFEEDRAWRKFTSELKPLVDRLTEEAYKISAEGLLSEESLKKSVGRIKKRITPLRKGNFEDVDGSIALSKTITTVQGRIANAEVEAPVEALGKLHVLGSQLTDLKREILSHIGESAYLLDREKIAEEVREEMFNEVLELLEDNITPTCFMEVRELLIQEYDSGS